MPGFREVGVSSVRGARNVSIWTTTALLHGRSRTEGGKGNGHGFQAGGLTGSYPVGEAGQRFTRAAQCTRKSTQQGPLFSSEQLTQIAQIFRMGIKRVRNRNKHKT